MVDYRLLFAEAFKAFLDDTNISWVLINKPIRGESTNTPHIKGFYRDKRGDNRVDSR